MQAPEIVQALMPVIAVLDQFQVNYFISGSVASSALGIARATADVDLVVDLAARHIPLLVSALEATYYLSEEAIKAAIRQRTSFNLIHLETMIKVDVFVLKRAAYDLTAFHRRHPDSLDDAENSPRFYLSSPEDSILSKLDWYQKGGCVSERQWLDVIGVMKVQASALDFLYLREWAEQLELTPLLNRALKDAGLG